ncbi:MAG: EscE/YscE/SsaE family type III secretion system needle protein co-chaperone [Pseudomonadota bacterium]
MSDELDFRMTDLEERLASADGAKVRSDILNKLTASGENISKKINTGLPPEEFEKAQVVYQGLAAAHEIMSVFPVEKQK